MTLIGTFTDDFDGYDNIVGNMTMRRSAFTALDAINSIMSNTAVTAQFGILCQL